MLRRTARSSAALAVVLTVALAGIASAATEKIKAHPAKVMVNSDTTLKGAGFPANTTLTLEECSATFWIFPNAPCNTANEETVETSPKGRFATPFKVELCPEPATSGSATKRTCYVGVPVITEDTGMLEPAAKVIVTYP